MTVEADDGRGQTAQAFVEIIILRNPDDVRPRWINLDVNGQYRELNILYNLPENTIVSRKPKAFDDDLLVSYFFYMF
jgi:hypothetical protein